MGKKGEEVVEGNCIVCGAKTRHAIRIDRLGNEYFECSKCGNKIDVKAFVYDNLDALD